MLGEYGGLAPGGAVAVVERLVDLAEGQALPDEVRGYLLSAIAKLHVQAGLQLTPAAAQLLHDASSSHNVDLQLRALQTQALLECDPLPLPGSFCSRRMQTPCPSSLILQNPFAGACSLPGHSERRHVYCFSQLVKRHAHIKMK